MADKKFSDFTDGGEIRKGDIVVGLRTSDLAQNYKFDFPGNGIKDVTGNYIFKYATAGASSVNAPKLINSISGTAVIYTAEGSDSAIDISIQPVSTGKLILDDLNWPTADGAAGTFLFTDGSGNLGFTATPVVTDISGTANQVLVNGTSGIPTGGSITLTTPQDIAPTSDPTFNSLTLTTPLTGDNGGTGINLFTTNGLFFALDTVTFTQANPVNSAVLVSDTSGVPQFSPTMSNGQIIIGGTGVIPTRANITAGTGISITNGVNSITISSSGGGISTTEVTGTSQSMSPDNRYIANNAGLVTLTLPVNAVLGSELIVIGKGAGGWLIAQNAGQSIRLGTSTTTVGVGGSLASTASSNSLRLTCTTANTVWTLEGAAQGIITVV